MKLKLAILATALFLACISFVSSANAKDEEPNLSGILAWVNQLEEKFPSSAQSALKDTQPQIQAMEDERFDGYHFDYYVKALRYSIVNSLHEKQFEVAKQKNEALQQLVRYFKGNMKSWETAHLVNAASGSFILWLYTDESKYKHHAEQVLEEGVKNDISTYNAFEGGPLGEDKEFLSTTKSIAAMRHINLYVQGSKTKLRLGAKQPDLQKIILEGREKYLKYKKRLQLKSFTILDKEYNNLLVTSKELLDSSHFEPLQKDYKKFIASKK